MLVGILASDFRVKVLAEKTSDGGDIERQISIVKKEMSGLHGKLSYQKRKLDSQDAELDDLKSKFRLVEMKREIERNYLGQQVRHNVRLKSYPPHFCLIRVMSSARTASFLIQQVATEGG